MLIRLSVFKLKGQIVSKSIIKCLGTSNSFKYLREGKFKEKFAAIASILKYDKRQDHTQLTVGSWVVTHLLNL